MPDEFDFQSQDKLMFDLFGLEEYNIPSYNEIFKLQIKWLNINDKFIINNDRGEFIIILKEDETFFIA